MPTTFHVFYLGKLEDIDSREGNMHAEEADKLVGQHFGGWDDPLARHLHVLSPGGNRFDYDGNSYYDMNDKTPETFRIDGGQEQGFDGTSVYDATLTYLDGTTANITAVIFQDTEGHTYLAPEYSDNDDQEALGDGPILSVSLDRLAGNRYSGMAGDREDLDSVPCFVSGTHVAVPGGVRRVEQLQTGDLVRTLDHGWEPVRWVGVLRCRVDERTAPVIIDAGALGDRLPRRQLRLSPQHRLLVRSTIARRMTGRGELLIAAGKLAGFPGVRVARCRAPVTYVHLLFDRHEVVFAEGAPVESLFPGPQALLALPPSARRDIRRILARGPSALPPPARTIPSGQVQRGLVRRHLRNAMPLLAGR